MKTKFLLLGCITALTAAMTSCSSSSSDNWRPKYFAVQVNRGDDWSIIDSDGKVVVNEEFDSSDEISRIYGETFWVKSGGKFQLYSIDNPKKPLTDDEWDFATEMYGERALVGKAGEPIQMVNEKGKVIHTFGKDVTMAQHFANIFMFQKVDGLYGWTDKDGKVIKDGLKCMITAMSANDGIIVTRKSEDSDTYLIFDDKGKETGTFTADEVWNANNGYIAMKKGDKVQLIDNKGKSVTTFKKARLIFAPDDDGLCVGFNNEYKYGLFDTKGESVIRFKYSTLMPIGDNLFVANKDNGKYGIIDKNDDVVVDFDYTSMELIDDHLLACEDGDWTVIDHKGKQIGDSSFERIATASPCDYCIYYVNMDNMVSAIDALVPELNYQTTVDATATRLGLTPSAEYRSDNSLTEYKTFGGQEFEINYNFQGWSISEETFHEVTKNDGWFDYTEQVSDGWVWKEASIATIFVGMTIDNDQLRESAVQQLKETLKNRGYSWPDLVKNGRQIEVWSLNGKVWAKIGYWDDEDPGC